MRRIAILLTAAALAGCGTQVHYVPLDMATHPMAPQPASHVQVYIAPRYPSALYLRIAEMKILQEGSLSLDGPAELLLKLRTAAGERGCDALVDVEPVREVNDADIDRAEADRGHVEGYRGRCVVFP